MGGLLLIGLGGGWWLRSWSSEKTDQVKIPKQQLAKISKAPEFKQFEDEQLVTPLPSSKFEEGSYLVTRIVDGDTIDVEKGGIKQRVRLIGIDTPESVDPRQGVECFGKEASVKLQDLIAEKTVTLEADTSQSDKDKYGRILRYVFANKENINQMMIQEGYAFEYTYQNPYKYQIQFKQAEKTARTTKAGLWSESACNGERKLNNPEVLGLNDTGEAKKEEDKSKTQPTGCMIKGNINTKDEKIYHLPGCGSYEKTQIDAGRGEKWFCTEDEARTAGWRKAGNCN